MTQFVLISVAAVLVAVLPLLISVRKSLINPALPVFLIVGFSILATSAYIAAFRSVPIPSGPDRIFVDATSSEFFSLGAWMALAGMVAYVAGYFLIGERQIPLPVTDDRWLAPERYRRRALLVLILVTTTAFVVYLFWTDGFPSLERLSAKRFQPRLLGTPSRFQYLPYYFFKVALMSVSAAYAASFLIFRAPSSRNPRANRVLFSVLFAFALAICYFASLRLFILIAVFQIVFLGVFLSRRRHFALLAVVVGTTVLSFSLTSLARSPRISRPLARPAAQAPVQPGTPERVASQKASSFRALDPIFEGRYLMNLTKLAHFGRHFPSQREHLGIRGLVGEVVLPGNDGEQDALRAMGLNRYLAETLFREPTNNVPPGFAGQLYISFGWWGLAVGFLALGIFHRLIFNRLAGSPPPLSAAILVVFVMNSTVLLFNSGIVPALSRSVIDLGILLAVCAPSVALGPWRRSAPGD